MPWKHRRGRSLDQKACKADALRENGPFSTASQDVDCGTARRGGRRRKDDRPSIKFKLRGRALGEIGPCQGIVPCASATAAPSFHFNGAPQTAGLTGAENFVLPSLHLPTDWTAEETTRTTITPSIPTWPVSGEEGRTSLCLRGIQASACVWVAAELLASRMHDAGKRWGTIHCRFHLQGTGVFAPVTNQDEALTSTDDNRANHRPGYLQPQSLFPDHSA